MTFPPDVAVAEAGSEKGVETPWLLQVGAGPGRKRPGYGRKNHWTATRAPATVLRRGGLKYTVAA